MRSEARTVKDYIASLPPERQTMIRKVRAMVRKHLATGYTETMT